jgi:hypothetical protein
MYDVFISYRQCEPDKTWVRKILYPQLSNAGLKVFIDFKNFRLAAPLVTEMERGVEESCYTLAVVTPLYFESTFTEFENLLSQHLSLEKSEHRLIILVRESCDLRLRLRYKLWVEMKNEGEVADNMQRLIQALKQPPTA